MEASWQHDHATTIHQPESDAGKPRIQEHNGMELMGINYDIDLTIHKDVHR